MLQYWDGELLIVVDMINGTYKLLWSNQLSHEYDTFYDWRFGKITIDTNI